MRKRMATCTLRLPSSVSLPVSLRQCRPSPRHVPRVEHHPVALPQPALAGGRCRSHHRTGAGPGDRHRHRRRRHRDGRGIGRTDDAHRQFAAVRQPPPHRQPRPGADHARPACHLAVGTRVLAGERAGRQWPQPEAARTPLAPQRAVCVGLTLSGHGLRRAPGRGADAGRLVAGHRHSCPVAGTPGNLPCPA